MAAWRPLVAVPWPFMVVEARSCMFKHGPSCPPACSIVCLSGLSPNAVPLCGQPQLPLWLSSVLFTCDYNVFVCAFRYASTYGRTCKPFNPLLGETFEYVDKKRNVRFIAEKVVHHPTVLAAHVEGVGWTGAADLEVKSKFWGRCIELKPVAYIQVSYRGPRLHGLSLAGHLFVLGI